MSSPALAGGPAPAGGGSIFEALSRSSATDSAMLSGVCRGAGVVVAGADAAREAAPGAVAVGADLAVVDGGTAAVGDADVAVGDRGTAAVDGGIVVGDAGAADARGAAPGTVAVGGADVALGGR